MRVKTAICIGLMLTVAVAVSACGTTKKPIPVIGFQPETASTAYIGDNASVISSVGIAAMQLTGPGTVWAVNASEQGQVSAAQADSLGVQMLVTNYSNKSGLFSERMAYATLKSAALTAELAQTLAADAHTGGWNGIMLDLELLKPRDADGLVRLVEDLRQDLPKGGTVGVTVSNNTSTAAFVSEGYDLPALADAGAEIVLMAYDDHGPWERQPGPVGPLSWQLRGIGIVRRSVPAKQLVLGVAAYGYAWERHHTITVSDAQAQKLSTTHGARPRWVPSVGEWTSRLKDGTVVWWSDGRSFKLRVALARRLHLGGMAIWSLASAGQLSF